MNKKHILIGDNDPLDIRMISELLEANGFKVDVACNGQDVLDKINQFPDLILISHFLPDVDGFEICKFVRRNKRLKHISVLLLTQENTPSEKVEGFAHGADDCLAKPVDNNELLARIDAVLRRNQVFRENQEKRGVLVTELKRLLTDELVTPHFQPIYTMKTMRPFGVEALSRPATNGIIDNAEFLFKTALILDMYSEVEMLCWKKAVRQWRQEANKGKLFLNCTPYFIESGRLNEEFLGQLNVDLNNIVLEITERTAIQKQDLFLEELSSLKELGVMIAVDDVGSGFASLDTVVEIRPDIVKIDRHLVRNLHIDELRYNIVQSVISFCKKSKVMTVAEGIECEEEIDAVHDLGVDAIQGFFVGMPSPKIAPDLFDKKFGE